MRRSKLWMGLLLGLMLGVVGSPREGVWSFPLFGAILMSSNSQFSAMAAFTPTPAPVVVLPDTSLTALSPIACPFLRGRTVRHDFVSGAMGERVRYVVYLPPCYDSYPDVAFPVLYLFHGWPLDEQHWFSLGIDVLADDWINRGIIGPFMMVMPGVGSEGLFVHSSGGSRSFEGMVVEELLPLVARDYRVWDDPAGRAVGGISRGGVWALEIALRHQDVFGIVGAHSPALALNRPLPQYDPFRLITEEMSSLRIYLDAGDADWARASTIIFRDALLAQDVPVTYDLHPGGHVDALWQGGTPDYLNFYTLTWPRVYADLPTWMPDPE